MNKKEKLISQDYLKTILSYDKNTGIFVWKKRSITDFKDKRAYSTWNARFSGNIAGGKTDQGYHQIVINAHNYRAHRLAWLYVHGEWPKDQIDHINRIRKDNRIVNLRTVEHKENSKNQKIRIDNTSTVIGVYWSKERDKWYAKISNNTKVIRLGTFVDFDDAVKERKQAEIKYNYHINHGMEAMGRK